MPKRGEIFKRRCKACERVYWPPTQLGVISPSGLEHLVDGYGWTVCKKPTGPGWHWPPDPLEPCWIPKEMWFVPDDDPSSG